MQLRGTANHHRAVRCARKSVRTLPHLDAFQQTAFALPFSGLEGLREGAASTQVIHIRVLASGVFGPPACVLMSQRVCDRL